MGCEGCTVYLADCYIRQHNINTEVSFSECPCRECLVKVMCDKLCKEFQVYKHIFDGGTSYHINLNIKRRTNV